MKLILVALMSLISIPAFAEDLSLQLDPNPVFSAGLRFGDGTVNNGSSGVLGLKVDWLVMGEDTEIGFLAPGINYQLKDQTASLSVSPIVVTSRLDWMFSIDHYPLKEAGQTGGYWGISIGWKLR